MIKHIDVRFGYGEPLRQVATAAAYLPNASHGAHRISGNAPRARHSVQRSDGSSSSGRSGTADPTSVASPAAPADRQATVLTAAHERQLRQIGSDLHDGPAQLLGLALLHLDGLVPAKAADPALAATVRDTIKDALREIRDISTGLVLPELDRRHLADVGAMAIDIYQRRTGCSVTQVIEGVAGVQSSKALKTCLFRFLQEGLNNGFKHARGAAQRVTLDVQGDFLVAIVQDGAFAAATPENRPASCLVCSHNNNNAIDASTDADGIQPGLGLVGLLERIRALGGMFEVYSNVHGAHGGTELVARLILTADINGDNTHD
jgi:signal transduction histidine kinase